MYMRMTCVYVAYYLRPIPRQALHDVAQIVLCHLWGVGGVEHVGHEGGVHVGSHVHVNVYIRWP